MDLTNADFAKAKGWIRGTVLSKDQNKRYRITAVGEDIVLGIGPDGEEGPLNFNYGEWSAVINPGFLCAMCLKNFHVVAFVDPEPQDVLCPSCAPLVRRLRPGLTTCILCGSTDEEIRVRHLCQKCLVKFRGK